MSLSELSHKELQAKAKELELDVVGSKTVLIERIEAKLASDIKEPEVVVEEVSAKLVSDVKEPEVVVGEVSVQTKFKYTPKNGQSFIAGNIAVTSEGVIAEEGSVYDSFVYYLNKEQVD